MCNSLTQRVTGIYGDECSDELDFNPPLTQGETVLLRSLALLPDISIHSLTQRETAYPLNRSIQFCHISIHSLTQRETLYKSVAVSSK